MEGQTLVRMLRELLNESSSSAFLNDRTSYDYLYTAIQDFNFRTHALTTTQSITIAASTSSYNLNPDYVGMALVDTYNRPYIKHTYSGSDTFIFNADYTSVYLNNSTATSAVAESYSTTDAAQPSNVTGTATSAGASANGESSLIDSTAPFENVYPGDFVHNTTQSTDGVVTAKTSSSVITTSYLQMEQRGRGGRRTMLMWLYYNQNIALS
jgi:hypothetical protein